MKLFAFVDTNILLHFAFFREVDWATELGVADVTLVLAPSVLAELDRIKNGGTKRDRTRARSVLKALDELGLSNVPVKMSSGTSLVALDSEPRNDVFTAHRLEPQVGDDRLMASIVEFASGLAAGLDTLLVTDDAGLRVKARARLLKVVALRDELELADEPDETEKELQKSQRELALLRSAVPEPRVSFDGESHIEQVVQLVREFSPDELEAVMADWRNLHPRISPAPDEIRIGTQMISLASFAGLPGFTSEEDARSHNSAIEATFALYREYAAGWPAVINMYRRTVELSVTLDNVGSVPAEDVDLVLTASVDGSWLEELPEPPEHPTVPRRPSLHDSLLQMPYLPPATIPYFSREQRNIDGPTVSEDDDSRAVYRVRRLKHHTPYELPPVFFRFRTDADVGSFRIEYRLMAANIREPKHGELHVRIGKAEPVAAPNPPGSQLKNEV